MPRTKGPRRPPDFMGVAWDSPQADGLVAFIPDPGAFLDRAYLRRYHLLNVGGSGFTSRTVSPPLAARSITFSGTGNLYAAPPPVTAVPFSITAWAASTDATASQDVVSIGLHTSAGPDKCSLNFGGATAGDPIRAIAQNGGTPGIAVTTTGYTAGKWHHVCGVFAANASRSVYIDGGSKGTNTVDEPVAAATRFTVGSAWLSSAAAVAFTGSVAEVRVYNRVLTDGEVYAMYDPRTRWDLYWQPARRAYSLPAAATFNAAWARGSNVILGAGTP